VATTPFAPPTGLDLDVDDAALATFAASVLPEVALALCDATWAGLLVADADALHAPRARLEHLARLHVAATQRTWAVSAHLFEVVGHETALHDHRYPLAVFAFAVDDDATSPLYEMTWVAGSATQRRVSVAPGTLWAVAHPATVQHTVKSLRPHASIVITDVSAAPTRAQRLSTTPMEPEAITRVRRLVRDGLARALGDELPAHWSARRDFQERKSLESELED
jgi:hypothetical protein